jgi:hypothetical protein
MFKSAIKYSTHCNSQVAEDRAMYSASEEDLETFACFLARHEFKDFPMKKQYPDIDFLVSTHPAQSASEYPINCICESLLKNSACPGLFFKHLITLQAALKCIVVRACIN